MQIVGLTRRTARLLRNLSRAQRDLIFIVVLAVPLFAFIVAFDVFDRVYDWTIRHAFWELEELFALVFCLGLAGIVYAARRVADLRTEIAQREEAEREARRLARHDVLTGLPNRRL